MDDSPVAETVGPEEAFSVLSDATRIEILQALWEADRAVSFSELRETVGVADSGQFNYHLDRLTDQFVRKTDDGYALAAAGIRVVGAILGGAYTMEGSTDPITLEEPCPNCGSEWTYRYEDEFAQLDCEACPVTVRYPIPPGTFVGADPAEMPERSERYLRALIERLRNELCPYCDSEIRPQVTIRSPPEDADDRVEMPLVEYDCLRCAGDIVTDLGTPLLDHPAVVGFHYERGIDVREPAFWSLWAFDPDLTTVEETDPLRVTVRFEVDGDRLSVTVDETMTVLAVDEP